ISVAPSAPIPAPALSVGGGPIAAAVAIVLVFVLGWLVVRPALLRVTGVRSAPTTPGAAVAVALGTSAVAFGPWVGDPYAAGPGGPEEVTVRGPVTYAGPGSLGGTESALRR